MLAYIVRRSLYAILVMFGVSVLIFLMIHLVPGDPIEVLMHETVASEQAIQRMRENLGLDRPLPEQYIVWLIGNDIFFRPDRDDTSQGEGSFRKGVIRGDLGRSIFKRVTVQSIIIDKFPATLRLTLASLGLAIPLGIVGGIVASLRRNSATDYLTMIGALVGVSLPSFWLGLMLMFVFGVQLGWIRPFIGDRGLITLILPAITLSTSTLAITARLTRSSMLDVLNQDYIRTARSKGLGEGYILPIHALRNAIIPVVTVLGLQFGYLLGGAVIVETVFAYPGLGRELVGGILNRDFPVVQGITLISATAFVVINLVIDILYTVIDPRIEENQ